jgi:hypothetical protein
VQWPLKDLIPMLGASRQSGRIEVADGAVRGEIFLREGVIVHAAAGGDAGQPALVTLMGWPSGTFSFSPNVDAPRLTLAGPTDQLLAECGRLAAERAEIRKVVPSLAAVPRLSLTVPSSPVTLQPQDWQVVACADGARSVADIIAMVSRDEMAICRIVHGLVTRGLVEIADIHATESPEAKRVTVSPDFFRTLTAAAAAAIGPLAPVIIDDEVEALGTTREHFPREQASSLVERVGGEIRDEQKRTVFQRTMLDALRQLRAA